jgi:hypothetical protein
LDISRTTCKSLHGETSEYPIENVMLSYGNAWLLGVMDVLVPNTSPEANVTSAVRSAARKLACALTVITLAKRPTEKIMDFLIIVATSLDVIKIEYNRIIRFTNVRSNDLT